MKRAARKTRDECKRLVGRKQEEKLIQILLQDTSTKKKKELGLIQKLKNRR
jgi:hypothetical protein